MNELPQIEGYRIERALGKGGMATVFLAFQEKLNRYVAIKVLNPFLMTEPAAAARFLKEAETAAGLQHPNVIPIFDIGQTGSCVYMIMEFLGMNLKERICVSRILPEECLRIMRQMAAALEYAHRKGIVHRDIKPENIMFREEGTAVLVDFGIARAVGEATRLTKMGMSIGTPHYMSPEQARGLDLDGRSDLYALGIVFYEMLTGWVPFEAQDSVAIIFKHIQDPIPRLPPHFSRWQPIVDTLLAKNRDERITNGQELLSWIDEIESESKFNPKGKKWKTGIHLRQTGKHKIPAKDTIQQKAKTSEQTVSSTIPSTLSENDVSLSKRKRASWLVPVLASLLVVAVGTLVLLLSGLKEQKIIVTDKQGIPFIEQGSGPSHDDDEKKTKYQSLIADARTALENNDPEKARKNLEQAQKFPGDAVELRTLGQEIDQLENRIKNRKADEAAFNSAKTVKTKRSYEQYLQEYPEGQFRSEAQTMIEGFEREEREALDAQAFKKAEEANTLEAFREYLSLFPSGKYRTAVNQKMSQLRDSPIAPEKPKSDPSPKKPGESVQVRVRDNFLIDLVWVPPGEFFMGWEKGADHEKPVRRVRISKGFWMGKYEVTQGQWKSIMKTNPSASPNGDNYPVENVSWKDVENFLRELNRNASNPFRLPTEAEWEYAARAGSQEQRYGELNAIAWFVDNSRKLTQPVGGLKPNAWNLHDMLGNVWEWCSDGYHGSYYAKNETVDPKGPALAFARVFRGGDFLTPADDMRVSFRSRESEDTRNKYIGFRLVRDD